METGSTTPRFDASSTKDLEDLIVRVYAYTSLFIVSIFTIVGNSLVIQAMVKNDYGVPKGGRRHRDLRIPGHYFVFSLAVSDLLLGIVYPIYNVSHLGIKEIEETLGLWNFCEVLLFLTLGLLYISSFNLVGITVTRYISIRDPLKFPLRFTHRRALAAVITTWVSLIVISGAIYMYRNDAPLSYKKQCRYEHVLNDDHIVITTSFFFLPLLINTCLYVHMAIIARKQSQEIISQQVKNGHDPAWTQKDLALRRELRMFKMAGMLLGYFAFAWLPFVIFEYCTIFLKYEDVYWIRATVRIILHSNTAVNVLIYAGRLHDFREAIKLNTRGIVTACGLRPQRKHTASTLQLTR